MANISPRRRSILLVERLGAAYQSHVSGSDDEVLAALAVAVIYVSHLVGKDTEELLAQLRELVAEEEVEEGEPEIEPADYHDINDLDRDS